MTEKMVAQKLFIRENYTVLLVNEPDNYRDILGELPSGVQIFTNSSGISTPVDFIQVFVLSHREMEELFPSLKSLLKPGGLFWVSYPKGTSKIKTDVNRDSLHRYAQSLGLKGVAMISVDEKWSAMRFKFNFK